MHKNTLLVDHCYFCPFDYEKRRRRRKIIQNLYTGIYKHNQTFYFSFPFVIYYFFFFFFLKEKILYISKDLLTLISSLKKEEVLKVQISCFNCFGHFVRGNFILFFPFFKGEKKNSKSPHYNIDSLKIAHHHYSLTFLTQS